MTDVRPAGDRAAAGIRVTIRARRSVAALLVLGAAVGCAPAPPTAAAPPPDPAEVCARQLGYWAEQQLRGADGGFDYQEMGLSSRQNDALQVVVDRARAQGPSAVPALARAECRRLSTEPSGAPATGRYWP